MTLFIALLAAATVLYIVYIASMFTFCLDTSFNNHSFITKVLVMIATLIMLTVPSAGLWIMWSNVLT